MFKSSDVKSSFSLIQYITRGCRSSSYMKAVGKRSRSQVQERSKIPIPKMWNFNRQQLWFYKTQSNEVCMQPGVFSYGGSNGVLAIFVTEMTTH